MSRRNVNVAPPPHSPNGSGDPSYLRRLNLQTILRVLHAGGVHTIAEIAQQAQLSRPTTKQGIDDLLAAGWAVPSDAGRAGTVIGRPAQGFEFCSTAGFVLGADIGGRKAAVLISDLSGTVVARARRAATEDLPPDERLAILGATIDDALAQFEPGAAAITDATIATPGTVDLDGLIVRNRIFPGWEGINLTTWATDNYPFVTSTSGDMSMAALAEHWIGAAQSAQDVLYLHAGRRLGYGTLLDGRPHVGSHGGAADIGIWRENPWRDDYVDFLNLNHPEGGRALFEAAATGDANALERVTTYVDELVRGITPIMIAIDPELFVIGGGLSTAGEAIVGPIRERIRATTPFAPEVVGSSLGDEAVALGSIRASLDRAEDRLYAQLAPVTR